MPPCQLVVMLRRMTQGIAGTFTHGTRSGYTGQGCRCDECMAWRKRDSARALDRARAKGRPEHGSKQPMIHGTGFAYRSKKCRCELCRAWNADRARSNRRVNRIIKQLGL